MTDPSQLRAAVARTIISPPKGIYLIGYGDRLTGCKSVHDDLTATALLLDDGQTQLVIIALDMLALNEHIVARVRDGVAIQWGVPPAQVMICCSHTHSGPIAYAGGKSRRKNRRFMDGLVDKLVAVVGDAQTALAPATLCWGQGEAPIAINRRQRQPDGTVIIGVNPDGPVDRSLNVLQLHYLENDELLATLVNFACHPTILGPKNNVVSAEWPGVMRREVEAAAGGLCMFVQGATADLNPNHEWGEDDMAVVAQFGRDVAKQVLNTIAGGMQLVTAVPLHSLSQPAHLPIIPQTKPDGSPIHYKEVLAKMVRLPQFLVDPILNARYPWQTTLAQRGGQWHTPLEIQVFRMGDCALVAQAAELFNEVGTAVKSQSPAPITLFAGYSNGCIGYLPTAAEHKLGGYEVEITPYLYRMPGLLDPGCDRLVIDQSRQMLQTLFNR